MSPPAAVPKIATAKSRKRPSHPPYFVMIKDALLALKEKGGSSPYAISKYIKDKHKEALPANFKKILGIQLKNFTTKGKLIKVKASFKLSKDGKKDKKKKARKVKKTAAAAAAAKPAKKEEAATPEKKPAAEGALEG